MKNVLVLTGAGQIGLAIVRSIGSGMKIVVSDKSAANAASAALLLNNAGFDAVEHSCDISSKESVAELIKFSKELLMFPCVNYPRVFTYLNRSSTF